MEQMPTGGHGLVFADQRCSLERDHIPVQVVDDHVFEPEWQSWV